MPDNKDLKQATNGFPAQNYDPDIGDYVESYGVNNTVKVTTSDPNTGDPIDPRTSPGIKGLVTGSVTVGSSPVELRAGTAQLSGRRQMIVYPPDSGTIYWGNSNVTTSTGAPLNSTDDPIVFDFEPSSPYFVYAITTGSANVRVAEIS